MVVWHGADMAGCLAGHGRVPYGQMPMSALPLMMLMMMCLVAVDRRTIFTRRAVVSALVVGARRMYVCERRRAPRRHEHDDEQGVSNATERAHNASCPSNTIASSLNFFFTSVSPNFVMNSTSSWSSVMASLFGNKNTALID